MKRLLYPAIALMNRLSFGMKFSLISILFFLPMLVTNFYLVRDAYAKFHATQVELHSLDLLAGSLALGILGVLALTSTRSWMRRLDVHDPTDLVVTFSESVGLTSGAFALQCSQSGAVGLTHPASGTSFTITTGASVQATAVFDAWIQAFNTQLSASFAGDSRVAIVNFNESSKDQADHPAQYQLSNTTTPACPATGRGSDGLPTYSFPTCTAAALSAAPPVGVAGGADWWKFYAFSDGFHPSPYVHQLMGQLVSRSLSQAGWL